MSQKTKITMTPNSSFKVDIKAPRSIQQLEMDAAVKRAEDALKQLEKHYPSWIDAEITALEEVFANCGPLISPLQKQRLYARAHDLKGNAPLFGYPLIGTLAANLIELLQIDLYQWEKEKTLIEHHIHGIRAFYSEIPMHGDNPKAVKILYLLQKAVKQLKEQ